MADLLTQLWSVLAPPPAPAGGLPLPTRRPDPTSLRPESFAVPNPLSSFDPQSGAFRGAPAAAPQPAVPPLPMRRAEPAAPPPPMRRPEPTLPPLPTRRPGTETASAPPLPARRPGMPNVPGIMVDNAPAAGGDDLVSQIRQVFTATPIATGMNPQRVFDGVGGPAQGTPQPPAAEPSSNIETASIGPWQTTVTPESSGPAITGKDVASFFRNLARGAATADPTAPGLTAFAQGMAGSMTGMHKEAQDARKSELEQDEREFDRRLKTADARLKQSKEQREARQAEIQNAKLVTEILDNLDPGLTKDQKFTLRRDMMRAAAEIRANSPYMKDDEMKAALETIVRTVDAQSVPGQGSRTASAATPSRFREGQTATGPNGEKIIFRNGQWQPL